MMTNLIIQMKRTRRSQRQLKKNQRMKMIIKMWKKVQISKRGLKMKRKALKKINHPRHLLVKSS